MIKHPNSSGPVVITESPNHFLVRISSEIAESARKIPGRQWDGNRKMWVFPKDAATFDALEAEFKAVADVFAIRRPHIGDTSPPKSNSNAASEMSLESPKTEEEFEEHLTVVAQHEPDDGQGIESLYRVLLGMQEGMAEHQRMLEVVIQKNDELTERLAGLDFPKHPKSKEIQIVKEAPELLDLTKTADLKLLEKALIGVAFVTCGRDQTFMNWAMRHEPVLKPFEFVHTTHELLKQQLEKIAGWGPEAAFWELVDFIRKEELIFCDRSDPIQVFHILGAMNAMRKVFGHPRTSIGEAERMTRSILYLMNLALVWRRVMVDEDAQEIETDKNQQKQP